MTQDPNVFAVESAAEALGTLMDELVLIGGCAVGLLITDRARPPIRQTTDVDLVTEVVTRSNYYDLCDRLRALGFKDGDITCRFLKGGLMIDVVPTEQSILTFTNSWYAPAAKAAAPYTLPNGRQIRLITAPYFLATKIEAFHSRGEGNYLHHDIEDVINIVDGRPEILNEVQSADDDVRLFLREEIEDFLTNTSFLERIPWHLHPDQANQSRAPVIVARLRALAGL